MLLVAKSIEITELGKQFFGTIGQQLALKLFAKGKKVKEEKDVIEKGEIYVLLKNEEGEQKKFLRSVYDSQREFSAPLKDLIQLEDKKENKLEVGYYEDSSPEKVAEISVEQKGFFVTESEPTFEERLEEEFDESKAEQVKIVGQFVDYYGMAHKYHFAFQARKNQDKIGKQKILCKTEGQNISQIIDYLKPENQKNVCISGKATKNNDDKIDKIKIDWINEDENFDPNQAALIQ